MPPEPAVKPAPAASILVLRDGAEGLQVLVLRRSLGLAFGGGMLAFPGGRVDAGDRFLPASQAGRGDRCAADQAFRVAALRELFEETGLLLARIPGERQPVPEATRRRLARRYRRALHRGSLDFASVLRRTGLVLETRALVPFAHWVTPAIAPKRFDTRFYLARAPRGQRPYADGVESLDTAWRRPREILAAWEAGAESLMFPTRLNLIRLARAANVREAIGNARSEPPMRVEPRLAADGTPRLVIPEAAGFGVSEAGPRDLHPVEAAALAAHPAARASKPRRA